MKITIHWLKSKSACPEGIEAFKNIGETDLIKLLKLSFKKRIRDKYPKVLKWANWLIINKMKKKQCVKYAVYAAWQVLKYFEEEYPDDKRPREAIEAAERYIRNPCKKTKAAAAAASDFAADAAYATANAAAYAAANAANAAAYAADAAYTANAADAAAYATDDVDGIEMKMKILKYGINLIEGGNHG